MGVNSITFNGVNSLTYDMYVSGNQTFNSAAKDYEKVSVPGRSGDLLLFNKRYQNVDVNYDAIVIKNYQANTEAIRAWLLSADGYCRLEDTYHPNEYRMAAFAGPINFDTMMLQAGQTELIFDCKPQRWLKSGETSKLFTRNGSISNPTLFEAKPQIRVYGRGTLTIGDSQINILTPGKAYLDIDCEIQDCYEGSVNRNSNITVSKWPTLKPGNNQIVLGTGITRVQITPRWWTL